ncbi:protease Do [Desulfobulbus propionicus DSM 2032]|uniref:Probable periplasmic serine endoprotease DegP-like n=1 Tax=Desulfobulbus propionicus (strain ATCC 33891 / DSM 2032 / VKM B-1956 / 1pr3) TaxID=577650 RepID=A0A7U4DQW5_DESPD|nr:DegQ family serine endoprotease [Desulfobulbus propionicus]ADW19467.1 protease Do [Desulfobulbus propionicus DSM 2032]
MHTLSKPRTKTILASCLLCLTLLAGGFHASHAQSEEDLALLDRSAKAFSSVVKKAGPAVVHVGVEKETTARGMGQFPSDLFNDPFFERFFGPQFRHPRTNPKQDKRTFKQEAAGSGFIIASDGYILTNNHVVEEASKITVRLADQREFPAKVVGTDPQSDVAIIKIDGKNLPVLPLGNSDTLEVGEWVIAIGSPFELNQTVTVGVVSAKGRNRMGITDYENFIQTDAAINPGNSGGPLLNIHGEAVGMNTAIFSRSGGYMGIGFAIPINMAKSIEQQLRKSGKVTRGWLGILIQDVNEEMAKSFGGKQGGGALISDVTDGSPAHKNGLQQGDIITAINGEPVTDVADLRNKIAMTPPNTELRLRILRDGQEKELTVTVGEQPADMASVAKKMGGSTLSELGLSLQDLTKEVAEQFGYSSNQGVLIADVEQGSAAAELGLQAGMLIEEVNRTRVRTLKELQQALKKSSNANQVLLRIRSGEHSQYVVLQTK